MPGRTDPPRFGLACVHFPVMEAEERGAFEAARQLFESCASKSGFEAAIWPSLISDAEEATKASRFFESAGVGLLVVQASSLAMGDVVMPLVERAERIALWVIDEPTYEGELHLNSLTGFNLCASLIRRTQDGRKKLTYFRGMGEDFRERFAATAEALAALHRFTGSRIASIGGVVPSFDNLEPDPATFGKSLGIDLIKVELGDLFGLSEAAPASETAQIAAALRERAACVRVEGSILERTARICHALRAIRDRDGADAAALRCWPEFQEWGDIAPCAAVAWANDNCMPIACEGDAPGAAAMLLGRILSGRAATMNDPVALDDATGSVQMWHCGPGPASWADEAGQCLDYHHTLNRRRAAGAPRAGLSSDIRFARGPVTILRIRGDGKRLFVLEGEVMDGPAPPYPGSGGWIGEMRMGGARVLPDDLLHMMVAYGLEHHYPIMRGRHGAALAEVAAWAGWTILPRLDSGGPRVF